MTYGKPVVGTSDLPKGDGVAPPQRLRLHPVLAARFSPLVFDRSHNLTDPQEKVLMEAARWAPSAGNSQPWMFSFRRRGMLGHDSLVTRLANSSARWAPAASALVVNLAHHTVEGTDWPYSEFAEYDLGQAVAHMTIQASAMGLSCRQFRAFDLDALTNDLCIPEGWGVVSMTAIGRALETQSDRHRRSVDDLRLPPPAPIRSDESDNEPQPDPQVTASEQSAW
jgi:nitroreductase